MLVLKAKDRNIWDSTKAYKTYQGSFTLLKTQWAVKPFFLKHLVKKRQTWEGIFVSSKNVELKIAIQTDGYMDNGILADSEESVKITNVILRSLERRYKKISNMNYME